MDCDFWTINSQGSIAWIYSTKNSTRNRVDRSCLGTWIININSFSYLVRVEKSTRKSFYAIYINNINYFPCPFKNHFKVFYPEQRIRFSKNIELLISLDRNCSSTLIARRKKNRFTG